MENHIKSGGIRGKMLTQSGSKS